MGSCRRDAAQEGAAAALPPSTPPLSATAGHVALAAGLWTWPCVRHSKPALSRLSFLRKLKMTRQVPAAGSERSEYTCAVAERSIGWGAWGAARRQTLQRLQRGRGGREAARAREEERAHTVPEKESGNATIGGYLPICEKSSHTSNDVAPSPPTFSEVYACACVVSPLRGAQAGGMEG